MFVQRKNETDINDTKPLVDVLSSALDIEE